MFQSKHLKEGWHNIVLENHQYFQRVSMLADDDKLPYSLKIWWADCVYWNIATNDWNSDGVEVNTSVYKWLGFLYTLLFQVLKESTALQTLCSSTHLTTFSSTFELVPNHVSVRKIEIGVLMTAFPGCLAVRIKR